MFIEFNSDYSPEAAYKKVIKNSNYGNFEVSSTIKNEQIVLKGGRNYSGGILAVLIIVGLLLFVVGLIIGLIYYWTRPYHKLIIEIEPSSEGSLITISSDSKHQAIATHEIKRILMRKEE